MDGNALLGTLLVIAALGFNIFMCLWCRRTINRISRNGPGPFRKIMKDLKDGR